MMKNTENTQTDQELATSASKGCEVAFEALVARYSVPLLKFASTKTSSFQDAEDAVQETFLRLFENIASYDSSKSLKSWLFTICYRIVISNHRRKKPQELLDCDVKNIASKSQEENEWLWDCARQLGDDSFMVLWLRYKQQMTVAEISQVLGKSSVVVRVLLHRSRKKLSQVICNLDTSFTPIIRQSQIKISEGIL